jgi:hypothetical protein
MITERLNRTSIEVENPSQDIKNLKKVNIGVLKQRLILERKKEKLKKTIFLSSLVASVGIISFLTY